MDEAFWRSIRENGYAFPAGRDILALTEDLCLLLGSPDPVLRDELAYSILATWVSEGRYSSRALRELGTRMVANLQHGLGDRDSDSVFLRAFSVLILGEIIAVDTQNPQLEQSLLQAWRSEALQYLSAEVDERGIVPKRGWAHAAAHTADCLGAFASHPSTDKKGLQELLSGIAHRVLRHGAQVFIHDEDERLAFACLAVFQRSLLSPADIDSWCTLFETPPDGGTWFQHAGQDAGARTYLNVKMFLRSLYLQTFWSANPPLLKDTIVERLLGTLRMIGTSLYGQ